MKRKALHFIMAGMQFYKSMACIMDQQDYFILTKNGSITKEVDYSIEPIDAVDRGAWKHDQRYGKVQAAGAHGLFKDWSTTPADLQAIQDWEIVVDIGIGGVDPSYKDQMITKAEYKAAKRGVAGFKYAVRNKKLKIASFMVSNLGIDHNGIVFKTDDLERLYQQFLSTYMEVDDEGDYTKRDGYWEPGPKGKALPIKEVEKSNKKWTIE